MDSERTTTFREEGLGGYPHFLIVTGVFTWKKKKRTHSLKVLEDKKYNLDHLESPPWPLGNIWERLCNRRKIHQLISFLKRTFFPEFSLWAISVKKKSWTRNHHISVQLGVCLVPLPQPPAGILVAKQQPRLICRALPRTPQGLGVTGYTIQCTPTRQLYKRRTARILFKVLLSFFF